MADTFDLTDYTPYLLNRAGARIAGAFADRLREHDLTLNMWRALAALHHEHGQRLSRLSELTSVDISTLSRLVGTLEKRALVERRKSGGPDADNRAVSLSLTAGGRALTETLIPVATRYEATALDGFTPSETEVLKSMLRRMFANMAAFEETRSAAE